MPTNQATELSQDSQRQYTNLDRRYGEIGISAVAAALVCQTANRDSSETRAIVYDRD